MLSDSALFSRLKAPSSDRDIDLLISKDHFSSSVSATLSPISEPITRPFGDSEIMTSIEDIAEEAEDLSLIAEHANALIIESFTSEDDSYDKTPCLVKPQLFRTISNANDRLNKNVLDDASLQNAQTLSNDLKMIQKKDNSHIRRLSFKNLRSTDKDSTEDDSSRFDEAFSNRKVWLERNSNEEKDKLTDEDNTEEKESPHQFFSLYSLDSKAAEQVDSACDIFDFAGAISSAESGSKESQYFSPVFGDPNMKNSGLEKNRILNKSGLDKLDLFETQWPTLEQVNSKRYQLAEGSKSKNSCVEDAEAKRSAVSLFHAFHSNDSRNTAFPDLKRAEMYQNNSKEESMNWCLPSSQEARHILYEYSIIMNKSFSIYIKYTKFSSYNCPNI
ncbi:unnamed protein product [Protopolystoma xenopodis]|uniref:Uncharacterized protein n=1 Tax=Protopolystoma xenopodis TaxID=117903 RepID=A0A448WTY0_9PLAT|nr:unnamed protein product [Protopolystoma xenopodis]